MILHIILKHISVQYSLTTILFRNISIHRSPPTLHIRPNWIAYLPCNNVQMTVWNIQIIILKIPIAKPVHLGNTVVNFISHLHMVAILYRNHFHGLSSSSLVPHSTWHLVHNQPPIRDSHFDVSDYHCKAMPILPGSYGRALKLPPPHFTALHCSSVDLLTSNILTIQSVIML